MIQTDLLSLRFTTSVKSKPNKGKECSCLSLVGIISCHTAAFTLVALEMAEGTAFQAVKSALLCLHHLLLYHSSGKWVSNVFAGFFAMLA